MTRTAIENLHKHWGLSTSDIATALGITERVARLARDGSEPGYDADRLDDFLCRVRAIGITDPPAWMSDRVVDGFTATRWNLYAAGRVDLLGKNAEGSISGPAMLDEFDADWRRTYWTSFKTVEAADGGMSVVGKSYDDVRVQVQ